MSEFDYDAAYVTSKPPRDIAREMSDMSERRRRADNRSREFEEALRVIRDMAVCEEGETAHQRYLIVEGCRVVARNALRDALQPDKASQ